MKNLEMKIEGEKLIVRHPDGVVVLLDFTNVKPELSSGAAYICGVRVAAKPAMIPAASGGHGFTLPPPAAH